MRGEEPVLSTHEMPLRDVLIVAVGSEPVSIVEQARKIALDRYRLQDQRARVFATLIDTDVLPEPPDGVPGLWRTTCVQLADDGGRARTAEYVRRVVKPQMASLQVQGLLPDDLQPSDLDLKLLSRFETGEANKNPVKGALYILANLRRVVRALESVQRHMEAPERTIYLVCSPVSGTSAGCWFVLLCLLLHLFPNTSPIVLSLMPSHVPGSADGRVRTYRIYAESALLLDSVVWSGATVDWTIPQLGGDPVEIRLTKREPLYVTLLSGYRRTGDLHLQSPDAFFAVVAELLALFLAGKHDGRGLPTIVSHILNRHTDFRHEEIETGGPTRRYTSPGFASILFSADLARRLVTGGLRRELSRTLSECESVGESVLEALRDTLQSRFVVLLLMDLFQTWRRIQHEKWEPAAPHGSLASQVHRRTEQLREDFLEELVKNLKDDEGRAVRAALWSEIQHLIEEHGVGVLHALPDVLGMLQVNEGVLLPGLASMGPEGMDFHGLLDYFRQRADAAITGLHRPAARDRRDELFARAVESEQLRVVLEVFRDELIPLFDEARRYYREKLATLVDRLRTLADREEDEIRTRHPTEDPWDSYQYNLTYALADRKLAVHAGQVPRLAREVLGRLGPDLDRDAAGLEPLRRLVSEVVSGVEGIDAFPVTTAEVLREMARDRDLLRSMLQRGRALVRVNGDRFDTAWGVWHTDEPSEELERSVRALERAMGDVLAGESFKVIVNKGSLPSREDGDVHVVFSETVLGFSLGEAESDRPVAEYWEIEATLETRGDVGPVIHRVHDALIVGPASRVERPRRSGSPSTDGAG